VNSLLLLLVSAVVCTAETAVPAAGISPQVADLPTTNAAPAEMLLTAGTPIGIEVFSKLDWIQGSAPKAWEPGKVYLLEFWATWCGPCCEAIPHVNELHKKYAEKGLIVTGIDIEEADKEKVAGYVKKKGDGMSYSVAFSGKEGPFLTQWAKAFGLDAIPTTIVVKDGKLLIIAHPMQLTDEIIEAILAGGSAQEKFVSSIEAKNAEKKKFESYWDAYTEANYNIDAEGITKAIDSIKELSPNFIMLPLMNFNLKMAKKDWAAAEADLSAFPEEIRTRFLLIISRSFLKDEKDAPAAFIKMIATAFDHQFEAEADAMKCQMTAALFWKAGDKESALKFAKQAAELAAAAEKVTGQKSLPAAPFVHYAEAMEQGSPPTVQEFNDTIKAIEAEKP
jgi:thiol-disulfide isomerase/thioredoxin